MFYLMNPRVWILLIALALYPALYVKGRHDGKVLERATTAAAVSEANREARKMEQLRQDRVDEAARMASARNRSIADSARHAVSERDGLLLALSAAERSAAQSKAAADQYRTAVTELLGVCSSDLAEMARKADGHASDVRLLLDAWPK